MRTYATMIKGMVGLLLAIGLSESGLAAPYLIDKSFNFQDAAGNSHPITSILRSDQLNTPNGIPQMNGSGEVINPINNSLFTGTSYYTAPDGTKIDIPQIVYNTSDTSFITLGGEAISFGGYPNSDNTLSGHMNVNIQSLPYGSYNMGCALCIFSSKDAYWGGGSQAALSGVDYRLGAQAIARGDMATAVSYRGIVNEHARFMLDASSFGGDRVVLKHPMTAAQMAQLHQGMYITANLLDPSCTGGLDSNNVYKDCRIRATINYWDATTIYVYGWGRMGGDWGGVSPDITKIDTTFTPYITGPVVWVGSGGKSFAGNDYLTINADNAYSSPEPTTTTKDAAVGDVTITVSKVDGRWGNRFLISGGGLTYAPVSGVDTKKLTITLSSPLTTAIPSGTTLTLGSLPSETTNSFETLERDIRIQNATPEHPISFHGTTESFECDNCQSGGVSSDSYGYFVNGPGGLANGYIALMESNALEFRGYSTYLPGNGGPDANVVGSNHIMFDFASSLTTNNTMHFGARATHEIAANNTWQDFGVRLGLNIDGTRTKDVFSGGVDMAFLAWNYNAFPGSLCILNGSNPNICAYNGGTTEVFGATTFDSTINAKGAISAHNIYIDTIDVSSASYNDTSNVVGGQGTIITWNRTAPTNALDANTNFMNISPGSQYAGGFSFSNVLNGSTVDTASLLLNINQFGAFFYKDIIHHNRTYSTLSSGGYVGQSTYCTDCYSKLREDGDTTTGIMVYWNGTKWTDSLGISILH